MSLIHFLLAHVPTVLLGFSIFFVYVFLSIAGLIIVRKYYPYYRCKRHNDIAGFIFATLGVIYAVLLAFTVMVTWEDFDKADEVVNREANYIASLHQDAEVLPEQIRVHVKENLGLYVKAIIRDEWQKMDNGERSLEVERIQEKLWSYYMNFQPKNETQKIFLNESVKKMNAAGEMRRHRLHYAVSGLHPVLYFILFFGSIITIAFTMLFGTENTVEQLIMTSCLAAMIALILYTIIVLDYPFTGTYGIKPNAFIHMLPDLIGS
jgi:Protein of unknown function (DUF4239)